MKLLLFLGFQVVNVAAYGNVVTGCNSKCSIVFAENSDCFNKSIDYHTQVLFGTFRNYVALQVNLINLTSSNSVALDDSSLAAQLTQTTVNTMSKEKTTDQSDQDNVLSASEAQPIVEQLVQNVLQVKNENLTTSLWPIYCPQGCEESSTLFFWLAIGSGILNLVFAMMGLSTIFLNYWKDIKYARKKKDQEVTKVTSNGHKH